MNKVKEFFKMITNNIQNIWAVCAVVIVIGSCVISNAPIIDYCTNISGLFFVIGALYSWKHSNAFGAILTALFGYVAYQKGFYLNEVVNVFICVPVSLLGWYIWVKNSVGGVTSVKTLTTRNRIYYVIASIILVVIALVFSYHFSAHSWIIDGISAAFPLIASILMMCAFREQWYVWVLYNALEVALYSHAGLAIVVIRVIFLLNSMMGMYQWCYKSNKGNK